MKEGIREIELGNKEERENQHERVRERKKERMRERMRERESKTYLESLK